MQCPGKRRLQVCAKPKMCCDFRSRKSCRKTKACRSKPGSDGILAREAVSKNFGLANASPARSHYMHMWTVRSQHAELTSQVLIATAIAVAAIGSFRASQHWYWWSGYHGKQHRPSFRPMKTFVTVLRKNAPRGNATPRSFLPGLPAGVQHWPSLACSRRSTDPTCKAL